MKRLWTASWKIVCFFVVWAILYAPFIVPLTRRLESPTPLTRLYVESMGAVTAANSVTQEVLFRGYIQQTIESCFARIAGILGSALLFALFHAGVIRSVLSALNIVAAGCLLGVGYAITRNLWLPIGLHFGWNFVQGPLLGLTVSGQSLSGGWRVFQLDGPALLTGGAFRLSDEPRNAKHELP
jgi:membrane protease YdiL (CAAX protease family)